MHIVVRGKREIPRQVLEITVRLEMSLADCRRSQGSRTKEEKQDWTSAESKMDVPVVLRTATVCEANPGKHRQT